MTDRGLYGEGLMTDKDTDSAGQGSDPQWGGAR